jgi:hypothetical protein
MNKLSKLSRMNTETSSCVDLSDDESTIDLMEMKNAKLSNSLTTINNNFQEEGKNSNYRNFKNILKEYACITNLPIYAFILNLFISTILIIEFLKNFITENIEKDHSSLYMEKFKINFISTYFYEGGGLWWMVKIYLILDLYCFCSSCHFYSCMEFDQLNKTKNFSS